LRSRGNGYTASFNVFGACLSFFCVKVGRAVTDLDAARRRQAALTSVVRQRLKEGQSKAEAAVCKAGTLRLADRMFIAREMVADTSRQAQDLQAICSKSIGTHFHRYRSRDSSEADSFWLLPETVVCDIAAAASLHHAVNDSNIDLILDNVEGTEELTLHGHFSSSKLAAAMQIRYSWTWDAGHGETCQNENAEVTPPLFVGWSNEIDDHDGESGDDDGSGDDACWEDRRLEVRGFTNLRTLQVSSPLLDGSFLSNVDKHFGGLKHLAIHDSLDEASGPPALLSISKLPNLQYLDVSFCQWATNQDVKDYCDAAANSQKEGLLLWQTIGCSRISSEVSSPILLEVFTNLGHVIFEEEHYVPPALANKQYVFRRKNAQ
jgi:hypothetical protein